MVGDSFITFVYMFADRTSTVARGTNSVAGPTAMIPNQANAAIQTDLPKDDEPTEHTGLLSNVHDAEIGSHSCTDYGQNQSNNIIV